MKISGDGEAGLALQQVEDSLHQFLAAGIAPSTARAYAVGRRRFEEFCQRLQLTPYPTSERVLLHFVASLGQDKLSHQTIKVYLASIRHIHVCMYVSFLVFLYRCASKETRHRRLLRFILHHIGDVTRLGVKKHGFPKPRGEGEVCRLRPSRPLVMG